MTGDGRLLPGGLLRTSQWSYLCVSPEENGSRLSRALTGCEYSIKN